jgi:hypothetical protein
MVAVLITMTFIAFIEKELLISKRGRLSHGGKKS